MLCLVPRFPLKASNIIVETARYVKLRVYIGACMAMGGYKSVILSRIIMMVSDWQKQNAVLAYITGNVLLSLADPSRALKTK